MGFFPSVIRLRLPVYFCDKSLNLIIVPFRKKQGVGSEKRFCYIMHVYVYMCVCIRIYTYSILF